MITPEARVEHVARAMCRVAGFNPDEQMPAETPKSYFASMRPALGRVCAWRRFLLAAENYYALSHNLAEPERLPTALRDASSTGR